MTLALNIDCTISVSMGMCVGDEADVAVIVEFGEREMSITAFLALVAIVISGRALINLYRE